MPAGYIKVLYIADVHLRDSVPSCRTDDFYNAQFNKLEEIIQISKDEKIDFIFNGGDLFDVYAPSYELVNKVSNILSTAKAPIYSIFGSHDMIGYNPGLIHKTAMGNLIENKIIIPLSKDLLKIEKYGRIIYVKGIHARKKLIYSDYDVKKEGTTVIVTHDPIVTEPVIYEHILLKDVAKSTNVEFILCSHIHTQFDVAMKATRFINPGPVSRQSVEEMEIVPKICMLEL